MAELHRLGTVASTNDELLRLALAGAANGTAVAAELQTAGRGRRGRAWLSPLGEHIFVSILWRPPESIATPALAGITLDVGAAIADVLTRRGIEARVKWPNDIWVGDKKIAGVLSELHDVGVIIGVGLNVNASAAELPDDIRAIATTVAAALGGSIDRDALLVDIVDAVRGACAAYAQRGAPDSAGYSGRCITLGRRVSVEGRQGTATGIAPDGALLVAFDGDGAGPERVVAGDVELIGLSATASPGLTH